MLLATLRTVFFLEQIAIADLRDSIPQKLDVVWLPDVIAHGTEDYLEIVNAHILTNTGTIRTVSRRGGSPLPTVQEYNDATFLLRH